MSPNPNLEIISITRDHESTHCALEIEVLLSAEVPIGYRSGFGASRVFFV